jgi:hypothetical protein
MLELNFVRLSLILFQNLCFVSIFRESRRFIDSFQGSIARFKLRNYLTRISLQKKMKKLSALFGISFLTLLFLFAADNASAQTKQRVKFSRGESGASVSGSVKGYKYIDYVIGARKGQTLSVNLTGSSSAEFAIMMPDGGNLGMDATQVREWTGELPASGDYAIRVLMPRAQARRGETIKFKLSISIK